jgi:hypothetical protein
MNAEVRSRRCAGMRLLVAPGVRDRGMKMFMRASAPRPNVRARRRAEKGGEQIDVRRAPTGSETSGPWPCASVCVRGWRQSLAGASAAMADGGRLVARLAKASPVTALGELERYGTLRMGICRRGGTGAKDDGWYR